MHESESQSDDPALKQALRRTLGDEKAPPGLHARVSGALARQSGTARWSRPMWTLAAAAVVLIGFGVAFFGPWRSWDREAPKWFAAAMVTTHDNCLAGSHTQAVPSMDFPTIATTLKAQLGYPVVAAPLGDDWTFAGAGQCQVAGYNVSHLLFKRGGQTISLFSVPAGALYSDASEGMTYSQVEQGHPVSGFVKNGGIHCLVGSSTSDKLSLREVTRLRDQLRKSPAVAHLAGSASACGLH